MQHDWYKQTSDQPLFERLLWSRPENRAFAGKLLIIGGSAHGFADPAGAYTSAQQAGIGVARVALPDALHKTLGRAFEAGEFVPSTPSGSFARQSLAELLAMAAWSDGTLLAGDLGRNSETAILLEQFLAKYSGQVTLTRDAIQYVISQPNSIRARDNTLLVLSFSQLQKLLISLGLPYSVTRTMDLFQAVDVLKRLTTEHPFYVITKHLDRILVAVNGVVSVTPCKPDERLWRLQTAAPASVWWLQNPGQPFEALTTSIVA